VAATLTALSLTIWVVAATVSGKDWLVFNDAARTAGVSWWPSPRSGAIASVMAEMPQGAMVISDRCTDLKALKLISGARVAFYNLGLAWPDNRLLFTRLADQRDRGELDRAVALEIGVGYLLTDSHCSMPVSTTGTLRPAGSSTYLDEHGKPAGLRLWKITG
jgi:hypothetical protein